MSTKIRPTVSDKNQYCIEKHRYYELKHFCMQYPIWKQAAKAVDGFSHRPWDAERYSRGSGESVTERAAMQALYYHERMRMVETAAYEADPELARYLVEAVSEGWSYEILQARYDIPCCREYYYKIYRKFFWILNKSHY